MIDPKSNATQTSIEEREVLSIPDIVLDVDNGFPVINSDVYHTPKGISYLRKPGVVLIAKTETNLKTMDGFLAGFDPELEFGDYNYDHGLYQDETGRVNNSIDGGSLAAKVGGQLCYFSFSPQRTKNKEATKYFSNIKMSGHYSVLEHSNYTMIFYGISRSNTHEIVRHRHLQFSQCSQRYTGGKTLRFVERPEYVEDEFLHKSFERRIELVAEEYEATSNYLESLRKKNPDEYPKLSKTELRKAVQQCSRSLLPNETEAPIQITGNARAWRHFLDLRSSPHAEVEIREMAYRVWLVLNEVSPLLFNDYKPERLLDGTMIVTSKYKEIS